MNSANSIWRQHWQLCWQTNRAYRIGLALTFLLFVSFYLLYTLPFIQDDKPGLLSTFLVRYIVEALCFVLVSHFFLRPPLNIHYHRGITFSAVLQIACWLLIAAMLLALVSTFISFLPALKQTDMQQIAMIDREDAQGLQMHFTLTSLVIMMGLMHLSLFIVWSLIYLGWQMRQSRKALQEEMQQARLQQLTNQLSPHFLFNSLNSIRALIFEDQHKAADTVTQLSELFRVHLQAHLRPTASLQEEWLLCQHYLKIEQVRLEDRLQIEVDIADVLLQQPLPTLTLLTLLENAVKHGISPNTAAGTIRIRASQQGKRWQLAIANSVGAASTSQSTGTGLKNCRKRLQLMHGDQATMTTERDETHFMVRIELPYAN
ncbi:histidine kinase [Alkalimonas collagenimarina]|uniref:Histidine kinase n=1 Tax=Alkalimonas collagenimarina TaxID=400390 RepID=A0ABT9H129_9GAMM|nr:histidine kinase [Alkalimonas collagenimarina]MDP4536605.1 histidine kinase [Alkalimonas collagenimarina]